MLQYKELIKLKNTVLQYTTVYLNNLLDATTV